MEWGELPVGGRAAGSVHDVKDYGVVCDLDAHPDIVALVTPHQVNIPATLNPELYVTCRTVRALYF